MNTPAVEVEDLAHRHGEVEALREVSLRVPSGQVLGVLGHNGAGKTTLIDILSTRLRPSSGSVRVCGLDVVSAAPEVRARIGVVSQDTALDGMLTGRQNLLLIARLLGAGRVEARTRVTELVEIFGLGAADREVRTWSGGMRRRLDLAAGLLGSPDVVFLDEPTTGLDPASRAELWRVVGDVVAAGAAVVLTTQYLEEADRLADAIVVLGRGRIVSSGSPAALKARLGNRTATIRLRHPGAAAAATAALAGAGIAASHTDRAVVAPIDAAGEIAVLVRVLDAAGIELSDLAVAEPSLDDVFLALDAERVRP
jgi:ABC-2 type transport system ATP-binding protein